MNDRRCTVIEKHLNDLPVMKTNIKMIAAAVIAVMIFTGCDANIESIPASADGTADPSAQGTVGTTTAEASTAETSAADTSSDEPGTPSESPSASSAPAAENGTADGIPPEALEIPDRIVLIGDSRTMHIGYYLFDLPMVDNKYVDGYTPDFDYILGMGGEGYYWLAEHTSEIEAKLTDGCALVINMGVNGAPRFSSETAAWCNEIAAKHADRGIKVYYMSVNPVNDSKLEDFNYTIRNSDVIYFNSSVKAELDGVTYLDTYSVVENDILGEGNGTFDGLHYNYYVCRKIWEYTVETVREK